MVSNWYEGMVVEVRVLGLIDHPGIVVRNGLGWAIIHNSMLSGKVVMTSDHGFSGGREIVVSTRYKSGLPPFMIARNARLKLGTSWTPLYNCQHFVSDVCGLEPTSHDLGLLLVLGGAAAYLYMARS